MLISCRPNVFEIYCWKPQFFLYRMCIWHLPWGWPHRNFHQDLSQQKARIHGQWRSRGGIKGFIPPPQKKN